ncbi:MAG: hypothetical protein BHV82_15205 [Odoribacter sp. 43_10]|nr:MAG: hypothetical protein BHV82_15205 [Odoribacter sp. 43_10]
MSGRIFRSICSSALPDTLKVESRHSIEVLIRKIEPNGLRIDNFQLENAEIVRGGELIFKY